MKIVLEGNEAAEWLDAEVKRRMAVVRRLLGLRTEDAGQGIRVTLSPTEADELAHALGKPYRL